MLRSTCAWLGALVALQGTPPVPPGHDELLDLERRFLAAEVAGDSAFFRRLELCDFRFVGWHGEEMTKSEDLTAVAAPRTDRVETFGVDDLIVRRYDDAVLVWGRNTLVMTNARGERRVSRSRFTHVYVRWGGRWRLAAAHSSPIARR